MAGDSTRRFTFLSSELFCLHTYVRTITHMMLHA